MSEGSDGVGAGRAETVPTTPAAALDLTGTRVLVTGATGGLGGGIVARFVAAGAEVVAQHRRPDGAEDLARSAAEARCATTSTGGRGPAIVPLRGELGREDGVLALVGRAVDLVGGLDVVVNNAGIQPVASLAGITGADWDELFATNVAAAHHLTRAFVDHRRREGGGGAVVHVASIEAHQPAVGHGHYAASKAALVMHARATALEHGRDGIRVNVVSPGLIHRPGLAEDWPDGVRRWQDAAPLGRLGQPDDVGDACVVLASPLCRWVTGAELVVDGGMLARPTW